MPASFINTSAVQPLLAEMSRINDNGRSKAVEQETKTQKPWASLLWVKLCLDSPGASIYGLIFVIALLVFKYALGATVIFLCIYWLVKHNLNL
jgi:hypothetical protein